MTAHTVGVAFDPTRTWRLHPQVAVRPEPFGALLYHFGTRKLSFLKNRTILHAGLDVYDKEPMSADHPFTKLDNITLIPHLGYVVEESYRFFYDGTIKDIEAWLDGRPINVLNPEALNKKPA